MPFEELRTGSGEETIGWGPREERVERMRLCEEVVAVTRSDPSPWKRAVTSGVWREDSRNSLKRSGQRAVSRVEVEDRRRK